MEEKNNSIEFKKIRYFFYRKKKLFLVLLVLILSLIFFNHFLINQRNKKSKISEKYIQAEYLL